MDTSNSVPHSQRTRRIGKKVIFCGRIAPALGAVTQIPDGKRPFIDKVKLFRPTKKQALITAALLVLFIGAGFGLNAYNAKRIADQQAAVKAEAMRVEEQNATMQECYKKKTAEKTDMLGKITFDQLYDGNACVVD